MIVGLLALAKQYSNQLNEILTAMEAHFWYVREDRMNVVLTNAVYEHQDALALLNDLGITPPPPLNESDRPE